MKMNSLMLTDGYKTGHHQQYPKGTNKVYSNWTPRGNKYAPRGCDKVVSFGQQMVMKWLDEHFKENFFTQPKEQVCREIKNELSMYLNTDYDVTHFEELHDLGYLPVEVKSITEGMEVPLRVPVLTIQNTGKFGWVTNFLETILSNMLWQPMTSATIALLYKRILVGGAKETDKDNIPFVDFQGHDFSMRGMGGFMSTILSGMGHITSFSGSDSLPVIGASRQYYNEEGFVVGSVNATEHSVMCAGTKDDEIGTFRRLMETYPTGILSIVSDTWDLWTVITKYLPELKEEIEARDGKIVIRPDSGDPVDIICGYNSLTPYEFNEKHVVVDNDHPSIQSIKP
jgi:nicotinamide phosphoribosyltransferase